MNILHTGRARRSGSWAVRGEQLGRNAVYMASQSVIAQYDAVVVVKRLPSELLQAIRAAGKPWAWDLVDFYPQPASNTWTRDQAIDWVRQQVKRAKPSGVIFPNERMRDDCRLKQPSTVIYHHHRPDIAVNPIRHTIRSVGYEGGQQYLGAWQKHIETQCAARGWQFVINPANMADIDLCFGVRDGNYYVPRHWKSNVKLANCHGSGTPFIGTPECGYLETASGAEAWVESPSELSQAIDSITEHSTRQNISDQFKKVRLDVSQCREQLEAFVNAL